jgi:hypothetical protein
LVIVSERRSITLRSYVCDRSLHPSTDLPVPHDDGAADHLPGRRIPAVTLDSSRDPVELADFCAERAAAGMSSQSLEEQVEFAARNHVAYPVLSDPDLLVRDALELPTFEIAGHTLYRRLALIAERSVIVKVFYPVFPPDRNAADVVAWLKAGQPHA